MISMYISTQAARGVRRLPRAPMRHIQPVVILGLRSILILLNLTTWQAAQSAGLVHPHHPAQAAAPVQARPVRQAPVHPRHHRAVLVLLLQIRHRAAQAIARLVRHPHLQAILPLVPRLTVPAVHLQAALVLVHPPARQVPLRRLRASPRLMA